ncbi:MAG: GIY-YIG nuclease family protein [Alphaproteobacteria bacterium]|nr:GIY-YIG nuclease family protein [Alphaproteobacteria bacterium]
MENPKLPAVYILASRYRGTLYVGVTSELYIRIHNHKNELYDGFTKKYQVKTLVWYAHLANMEEAINVEKQIKAWKRQWKIELVEKHNSDWSDLHEEIDGNLMYFPPKRGPSFRWDDGAVN